MIDEAIRYSLGFGWQVFPLSPGSKKPLQGTNGFLDATNDLTTVARWWSTGSAGIALATGEKSGVWVLDIDTEHNGQQSLFTLVEELDCEELLNTRTHQTVNDGYHLIYRWTPDVVIPRKINAFKRWHQPLSGIDLLGNDGYAVLPPTTARNRVGEMGSYTVLDDQEPQPAPLKLLSAVSTVLAGQIQGPTQLGGQIMAPPKHGTSGMIAWLAAVPPGGQDDAMSWVSRALRDEGCSAAEAADLLWEATQGMSLSARPWNQRDIERHIRSAYR